MSTVGAYALEEVIKLAQNHFSLVRNPYFSVPLRVVTACMIVSGSVWAPGATFCIIGIALVALPITNEKKVAGKSEVNPSSLPTYLTDLTSIAEEEDFPDSGHEGVIEQLEAVLKLPARRNAILKGPPGSGKSTIAKILAQRIVKDQLGPDSPFKGKRILSTNLTAFYSGATYRGQPEARAHELAQYMKKHPDAVLFFDNINDLSAKLCSYEDPRTLAGLFTDALSCGDFRLIGAANDEMYVKQLAPLSCFCSQFKRIEVHAPDELDCLRLFMKRKDYYSKRFEIEFSDAAIYWTVFLAGQLNRNSNQILLRSTTALLDEFCSDRARVGSNSPISGNDIFNYLVGVGKLRSEDFETYQKLFDSKSYIGAKTADDLDLT